MSFAKNASRMAWFSPEGIYRLALRAAFGWQLFSIQVANQAPGQSETFCEGVTSWNIKAEGALMPGWKLANAPKEWGSRIPLRQVPQKVLKMIVKQAG